MGSGYGYIDILIFAAIAGFLVFRLRSVLGRRTGTEQRRDPFNPPTPPVQPAAAPSRNTPWAPFGGKVIEGTAKPVADGPSGMAAIKAADPSFAEEAFLKGAGGAFEIIVNAFGAGDTGALKPLLSPDVFSRFAEAIRVRVAAKESVRNTLVSMKSAEISDAQVEGNTALVTAKFISEQTNVTYDAAGKVVDGDPDKVVEHCDFWTFARALRTRNPNWILVATHSP